VSVTSAATALCAYAELPEFRETPASRKALEGLLLAARARLALARDKRTYAASVKVRANEGALSVTYLPKDGGLAPVIPEVLEGLSGVRDLRCTMATTNVLWVQECFDPSHPDFQSVTGIAERWNAAVEVLRVVPAEGGQEATEVIESAPPPPPEMRREVDGGIEDDVVTPPPPFAGCDDEGLRKVFEELTRRGIAGSMRTARSDPRHINLAIDRTVPYSLVVLGDIFVGKGHAASQRLTRELRAQLADTLRVPVIKAEELKSQYFLGPLQLLRLAGFALGVLLLYVAVFSYQREVLQFLTPETTPRKLLAAVVVMVFVPTVAYLYGTLTKSLLKLVKIE
jgi:hypothetical protein